MRDQILKLHTLPEAEQRDRLIYWQVLKPLPGCFGSQVSSNYESLAELAFRLRENLRADFSHTQQYLIQIWRIVGHLGYPDSPNRLLEFYEWWAIDAKPIHWIQAALLAKEAIHDQEGER